MKDYWEVRVFILTICTYISRAVKSLIFVRPILMNFTALQKRTSFCGFTCMINEQNTVFHSSMRM